MKSLRNNLTLVASLLMAIALPRASNATGISWSSAPLDNLLQADGITTMDGTFEFELGGFTSGFTPTAGNLSLWESNWIVFDTATVANGGWSPTPPFPNYTSSATANAAAPGFITSSETGQTFTIGQQAYMWTFNTQTIGSGAEWSLITNTAWLYPANNPFSFGLDWVLGDPANTAVVGATSFDGGTFISTLQTQAVPEPGSALLVAVAGVLIRLRRRFGR